MSSLVPPRPPQRPQPEPPVRIVQWKVWLARALVLTGGAAIIGGVAIVFWPAAIIIGGAIAVALGIFAVNVSEAAEEQPPGG